MFKVGDAIVHPTHGAGVIVGFKDLKDNGSAIRYYKIKLLKRTNTSLMVPVQEIESHGIRHAISKKRLGQVWFVLNAAPQTLPDNYKSRHRLLEEKLDAGNILEIAEAVRDIAWRQHKSSLTDKGKQIYRRGLMLLAGELAAVQEIGLADAEAQVRAKLRESLFETIDKPSASTV
jgi:CarD family transcriptional regulator